MSSFLRMYSNGFYELLAQKGYSRYGEMFLKELSDSICVIIYVEKTRKSRDLALLKLFIDIVPYCADLKTNEYEPEDSASWIVEYMKILTPDKFTKENIGEYFRSRFSTNDKITAKKSLNNLCHDLDTLVLPYIHKFENLSFYYGEIFKLGDLRGGGVGHPDDYFTYGLSLKLHEYNNALLYVDRQIEWYADLVNKSASNMDHLEKGDLHAYFNMQDKNEDISYITKRKPNLVKDQMEAAKKALSKSRSTFMKWQHMKVLLQNKDSGGIDKIVEETETRSRKYLTEFLKL